MERVNERAIVRAVGSDTLSPRQTSNVVSCLPDPPDEVRQRKLIAIIMEVEMVKMLNPPLTPQQRTALMLMLHDTGLPLEEIARVGRRVIEKTTYNNIAFEHWKSEMDFSGINNLLPDTEPDRYCPECDANHRWDVVCPKLSGT